MELINFKVWFHYNKRTLFRILLCIIGSFILAFGTSCFLIPAEIVAGGTSGIGMILNHFLEPLIGTRVEDIVVWTINIILFIIALIFLGKKFAFNTLVSTIAFPLFLTLMLRTNMIGFLSEYFVKGSPYFPDESIRLLLAGIFSGLTIGIGVSLTFLGDGSTGGFDVIYFLLEKYAHIKQSISSFILDALTILIYAIVVPGHVIPSLVGVISALISAIMIEIIYIRVNSSYIVDIITDKYKDIDEYVIKKLNKTTTLIVATGAYTNKQRKLVRFVISRRDFKEIKKKIARIDPNAFIMITRSETIYGKGFTRLK